MNKITRKQVEKMLKKYADEIADFMRGEKSHEVVSAGAKEIIEYIFGEEEPEEKGDCEGCK